LRDLKDGKFDQYIAKSFLVQQLVRDGKLTKSSYPLLVKCSVSLNWTSGAYMYLKGLRTIPLLLICYLQQLCPLSANDAKLYSSISNSQLTCMIIHMIFMILRNTVTLEQPTTQTVCWEKDLAENIADDELTSPTQ